MLGRLLCSVRGEKARPIVHPYHAEILEKEGVVSGLELHQLLKPLSELPLWVESETMSLREETAQEREDREKREARIARFGSTVQQVDEQEQQEWQDQEWQQLREV